MPMSGESLRSLYLIAKPGVTIRHSSAEYLGVLSAGINPYHTSSAILMGRRENIANIREI